MSSVDDRRRPVLPDRVRSIPKSFSWIDRDILHRGFLKELRSEEILLYFFLALVSGPDGTSFWSRERIGKVLKLEEQEILEALRGLLRRDLVAFRYPTFQVLSLPERRAQAQAPASRAAEGGGLRHSPDRPSPRPLAKHRTRSPRSRPPGAAKGEETTYEGDDIGELASRSLQEAPRGDPRGGRASPPEGALGKAPHHDVPSQGDPKARLPGRTYDPRRLPQDPSRSPPPGRRAFRRFETSPAEESQQDWTSYKLEVGGKLCSVQVFSLILCWSRQQFLRAYLDQRQSTLLWAHVAAFHYFEGMPWKIVYDRQRTISPFEIDGKPVLHEKFRAFAEHYGFDVFICEGGDKERKGKIERPFLYLETSFLPRRRFESLEDLNRQLRNWLDGVEFPEEGNRRIHETTNEVPHERWLEEKEYLLELPQTDFLPRRIEERQVTKDATVSVGNTRYSVPARLVEKGVRKVWVSVGEEDLLVQDPRGEIVARHRIDRHRKLVIDDEHYKEIRRLKRGTHHVSELERKFLELFPQRKGFLEGAKKTLRSIAPIHLREILALVRRYRRGDVDTALECALSHGTTTAGYVREILERKRPTGHLARIETETPRGLALGPVDPGSAEGYEAIFEFEKESEEEKDKEDDR